MPFLLFTLPAGVWVDRLRRRPILVAQRHRACRGARLRPGRVRARRADHLAALRGRLRGRHAHGLLRRRVPVVSPLARRAHAARRGQLAARDQPHRRADRRPGGGRRARRGHHGAGRDRPRRRQLPRLGGAAQPDPDGRASGSSRSSTRACGASSSRGSRYLVRHRYWRAIAITTGGTNFFWMICGSILLVYAVRELEMSPAADRARAHARQPRRPRGGARRGPPVAPVRRRPDDRRRVRHVRPAARPRPARAAVVPDPALVLAFLVSSAGGTIYIITGHQPHADAHPGAPARADERVSPLHRLRGRSRSASLVGGVLASVDRPAGRRSGWARSGRASASCPSRSRRSATSARCRPSRSRIRSALGSPVPAGAAPRCLSCPRWRPGCASSTRSSRRAPIEQAGPGAHRDAEDRSTRRSPPSTDGGSKARAGAARTSCSRPTTASSCCAST